MFISVPSSGHVVFAHVMELVDMRGLKPRPYRVLVQVQVWVKISEFFGDVFLFQSFLVKHSTKSRFQEKWSLRSAIFGSVVPHILICTSLCFFICPPTIWSNSLFTYLCNCLCSAVQIYGFDPALVTAFSTDLISEASVTTLLSHAAFFYLLCCVVFLVPIMLIT